jgi:hypothetical protein
MQNIDKIKYKNKLKESIGISPETHNATVHYYDNGKTETKWFLVSEKQDILGSSASIVELLDNVSNVNLVNENEVLKVLDYIKSKKENLNESTLSDRLFFADSIYGVNNHNLRVIFKESNITPATEKSFDEVLSELESYPTSPEAYPQGINLQPKPNGQVTNFDGNEIDFILTDLFDDVLSSVKGLRTNQYAEDRQKAYLAHLCYEALLDGREKMIKMLKEKIAEQNQPQQPTTEQPAQPQV